MIRIKICESCGKEFEAKSNKALYCSQQCKFNAKYKKEREENLITRGEIKECIICKKQFKPTKKSDICCSDDCKRIRKNNKCNERRNGIREDKFNDKLEGKDYVVCKICGIKSPQITSNHLKIHNISLEEYLNKYPDALITCDNYKDNFKNSNNPNSKENTTYEERQSRSPFSDLFYIERNKNLSDKDKLIENIHSNMLYNTQIEYYIEKGFSIEESKLLLKERQSTFLAFKKFDDEDILKFLCEYQGCVRNNLNRFSIVMSIFIYDIFKHTNISNLKEIYKFGIYEYNIDNYYYDLTNIKTKKCIEFNGDYWHCNPNKYKSDFYNHHHRKYAYEVWEKDARKIEVAKSHGFEVLTIWESDYKKNPEEVLEKAKQFIL